uniref:Retrotransposon gag domain-containing protein n=1 Tax=Pectinophora gossypiella TaxID=13191 RepID=A0A1E1WBU5_PECGO
MAESKPPSTPSASKKVPEIFISESCPLQVLCNFINPYKGDRETLTAFLTNCQNALDLASPCQKIILLKYIIAKLEGKAQVACSNKVFETFDELKLFLNQNFGERKHYNHLLLDLQSCKQQFNETVAQFALRIESCLTSLQSEIHNSASLKKELVGRLAMTEDLALFTFNLGLSPRLSTIVRCREPRSLNDAINIALEEEKLENLVYKVNRNKQAHSHSEGISKPKRNFQNSISSQQNSISQKNCRYCKNPGHDISECFKRKHNNSKRNSNYQNNNPTAPINHVADEAQSEPESYNNSDGPCELCDNDNLN